MSEQTPAPRPPGTLRIGQIAGVDVLVRSSWLVVAVLIAFLMAPQIEAVAPGLGALKYVAGLAFAILLYLSVLLHEASHAISARHYGLPDPDGARGPGRRRLLAHASKLTCRRSGVGVLA